MSLDTPDCHSVVCESDGVEVRDTAKYGTVPDNKELYSLACQ